MLLCLISIRVSMRNSIVSCLDIRRMKGNQSPSRDTRCQVEHAKASERSQTHSVWPDTPCGWYGDRRIRPSLSRRVPGETASTTLLQKLSLKVRVQQHLCCSRSKISPMLWYWRGCLLSCLIEVSYWWPHPIDLQMTSTRTACSEPTLCHLFMFWRQEIGYSVICGSITQIGIAFVSINSLSLCGWGEQWPAMTIWWCKHLLLEFPQLKKHRYWFTCLVPSELRRVS